MNIIQAHIQSLGEVACTLLQVYPDGDARVSYEGRQYIVGTTPVPAFAPIGTSDKAEVQAENLNHWRASFLIPGDVPRRRTHRPARTLATRFACLRAEPVAVLRSRRALRRAMLIGA